MSFADDGIDAPDGFETAELRLRPIRAADAELDHEAVMESRELLRLWEQSTWPEDDFTVEANRADLSKMERRHAAREAFGYTVVDLDETQCLGCVYVFPPDARWFTGGEATALHTALWSDVDALFFFWVRAGRLADGLDRRLLASLRRWAGRDWPFEAPVFVTTEPFAQQVEMMESEGLRRRFSIVLPEHPGAYLAYA